MMPDENIPAADDADRSTLCLNSHDLSTTEEIFSRAYTKTSVTAVAGEPASARIERRRFGPVDLDELRVGFHMAYDAAPLHRVCVAQVHAGRIVEDFAGEDREVLIPGDVTLFCHPELPYSARVCAAAYDLTIFDVDLLGRVAGHVDQPVRLLGHRPVSPGAGQHLTATIEYVRALAQGATPSRLVASTTAAMLAAAVLSAFPNTAAAAPVTPADHTDDRPALLRRAIAYLEAGPDTPITLSDVADAVHVTPRALQYMFRRHLDMTPMEYLRRVRLDRAHQDLLDADPTTAAVKQIAARWGFAHTGRFAALYRQVYGRMPSDTLRH